MWPHNWGEVQSAAAVVLTVASFLFASFRIAKNGTLSLAMWSAATALLVATLAVEGRYAVFLLTLLTLRWSVRTFINNRRLLAQRRARHTTSPSNYPYRRLAAMNRWLVGSSVVTATASVTFMVSPQAAFVPTLGGYVLTALALAQGIKKRPHDLASSDRETGALNRLLFALSFPKSWGSQHGRRFAPISVFMWIVASVLTVSLVTPPWGAATDTANAFIADRLMPRNPDGKNEGRTGGSHTEASDSAPDTTPTPIEGGDIPAECVDANLRVVLQSHHIAGDVVERVLVGRERYSWPIVGCTVESVSTFGGAVRVVFVGGSSGPAVVVDDGHAANAAISTAAAFALEQLRADRSRQLVGLSAGARAGTGRWYLESWSDGSCQLLESRDGSVFTGALSYGATVEATRIAGRLDAFPMIGINADGSQIVEYIGVDSGSPNGYRVVTTKPARAMGAAPANWSSCLSLQRTLMPIAARVEASAQLHRWETAP